jgi:uncharacterized phiE125 gp8 family phage protein
MTLRLITLPSTLPVTVAQAKANGRIDHDAEDSLVEGLIRAALSHVEKWCGRAFEAQVWEEVYDTFPANEIELTFGPVASVTSVKYTGTDGIEVTVSDTDYEVDLFSPRGWVVLNTGGSWPTAMETLGALRVRFVAGTGTPPDVAQAILLMAELWYEHRSTASAPELKPIPFGAMCLLELHRRMFV